MALGSSTNPTVPSPRWHRVATVPPTSPQSPPPSLWDPKVPSVPPFIGSETPISLQYPLGPLPGGPGTPMSPPQWPWDLNVPSSVALGPQCPLVGGPGTPMSPLSPPCWLWDPQIASMPLWFPHGGSGIPTSPQRPPGPLPSVPTSPAVPHPISAGHGGQKSATTAGDDVPHVLRFGADAGGDVDLIALGT